MGFVLKYMSIPLNKLFSERPTGSRIAPCSCKLVLIYLRVLRCSFLFRHRNASF